MRRLIDLLLFSLYRRSKPNKYHSTRNSHDSYSHDVEHTYGHEHAKMQEAQLDDALRENDEMFLRVIATGNGVKKLFTAQEANAISLLAARYEAGEFQPQQ
ncbi:MAG: hypothetical protein PVS3B3_33430 [Ktedonobacteraceae bacterium]